MHIHPSSPNSAFSLQSEENAAITIQARFRAYRVRKELDHQNRSQYRSHRRQQRTPRHHHQVAMNGKRTGTIESDSVSTISNASVHQQEERIGGVEGSVEDRCAAKIQAGVRGFLVRKKQKLATDAATKIQAGFRGFMARKETQKLRQN